MKQSTDKHGAMIASPLALAIARMFGSRSLSVALLSAMAIPTAYADPQGGSVVAGQAAITKNGNTTTITQATQRAAIDWQSFNVRATETVHFQQPDASSTTLNRVIGNDASSIFGRISANGTVLLINPNGILFGRTAQVDVGGLVASTANISNADFMASRMAFTQPGHAGALVENQGSITVGQGGFAALVGRGVSNSGVIHARLGKVSLAAGDAFVLDLYGDTLVNLIVDPAAMSTLTDATGMPLAASVDHSGNIVADGGVVQLTAGVVKQLVDNVINVSGTIRATSFDTEPGLISLRGDAQTNAFISGNLDATGVHGGRIEATARDVALRGTAVVDASGSQGGGVVAIGGDWQGKGALPNAQTVSIERGAHIDVSATDHGSGGIASIWADGTTRFDAAVAARGGRNGGDGGKVEVSGKVHLGFDGDVDASAAHGVSGSLLLDPINLTIDGATGSQTLPATGSTGDSTVNAAAVNRQLVNGTSVVLQADNNITINANAVLDGRLSSGSVSGGGLTLTATHGNVAIGSSVILNDAALNVTAGGSFTQASGTLISTGSGALSISSSGDLKAQQLLSRGAVTLESRTGTLEVGLPLLDAGSGGRLQSLTASGAAGVVLNGARVGDGGVNLTSQSGSVVANGILDVPTGNVTVAARGAVTLGPATVKNLSVHGAAPDADSASFTTTAGSPIAANGGITVRSSGEVVLGDALTAQGPVNVVASNGSIVLANPGIRVVGAQDLSLQAKRSITLHGALQTEGGHITVESLNTDSAVNGDIWVSSIKTNLGRGASGSATFTANRGNIVFSESLGGPHTGYTTYALGYQQDLKPTVGALTVTALHGGVELNGLNLDGNSSPNSAAAGLSVRAQKLVSNDAISVNKGAITLQASGDLLLGNSVESRGYDPADHAQKMAFPIDIRANRILIWDNTSGTRRISDHEMFLPTTFREISISNNTKNYADETLVAASLPRGITVEGNLQGLNVLPKTKLRLNDPSPVTSLAAVPNDLPVTAGTRNASGVLLGLTSYKTPDFDAASSGLGEGTSALISTASLGNEYSTAISVYETIPRHIRYQIGGKYYISNNSSSSLLLYPSTIAYDNLRISGCGAGNLCKPEVDYSSRPEFRTSPDSSTFAPVGSAFPAPPSLTVVVDMPAPAAPPLAELRAPPPPAAPPADRTPQPTPPVDPIGPLPVDPPVPPSVAPSIDSEYGMADGLQPRSADLDSLTLRAPALEADLGRASPLAGAAADVFSRQYQLVNNRNPALCVPAFAPRRGSRSEACIRK